MTDVGSHLSAGIQGIEAVVDKLLDVGVAPRGKSKLVSELNDWPSEKDRMSVIEGLLTEVGGRRVHVFAKADTPGFESVVGDANWSTEIEASE